MERSAPGPSVPPSRDDVAGGLRSLECTRVQQVYSVLWACQALQDLFDTCYGLGDHHQVGHGVCCLCSQGTDGHPARASPMVESSRGRREIEISLSSARRALQPSVAYSMLRISVFLRASCCGFSEQVLNFPTRPGDSSCAGGIVESGEALALHAISDAVRYDIDSGGHRHRQSQAGGMASQALRKGDQRQSHQESLERSHLGHTWVTGLQKRTARAQGPA